MTNMKRVIGKLQNLSEKQVIIGLTGIGTFLFLAMFLLMPPTTVVEWEDVGTETGNVKTLATSFSKYSGTKVYAHVEMKNGEIVSIPISMTDDIRAGDNITFLVEVNNAKKPQTRYTLTEFKQKRDLAPFE